MIVVTFRKTGEPEQTREYPDDRLQELMDRANATFGNPAINLGGPSMSEPKPDTYSAIPPPRRKRSN